MVSRRIRGRSALRDTGYPFGRNSRPIRSDKTVAEGPVLHRRKARQFVDTASEGAFGTTSIRGAALRGDAVAASLLNRDLSRHAAHQEGRNRNDREQNRPGQNLAPDIRLCSGTGLAARSRNWSRYRNGAHDGSSVGIRRRRARSLALRARGFRRTSSSEAETGFR